MCSRADLKCHMRGSRKLSESETRPHLFTLPQMAFHRLTAQFGAHGMGATFGITPTFRAKAMKRGSSL